MDIYKEKFTKIEKEILRYLFLNTGKNSNQRTIALTLKVSPTAVANSIKNIQKQNLIKVIKNKLSNTFEIGINIDNDKTFFLKRVENLRMIYDSGLAEYLFDNFPGATIILFGSFAFGEDNYNSDIDIAVIGNKKELKLEKFEKILNKKIIIQIFEDFEKIHKNLKESIFNGIILKGSVKL